MVSCCHGDMTLAQALPSVIVLNADITCDQSEATSRDDSVPPKHQACMVSYATQRVSADGDEFYSSASQNSASIYGFLLLANAACTMPNWLEMAVLCQEENMLVVAGFEQS